MIQRFIRHCGMHSHISDYEHEYAYIIKEFSTEECIRAHQLATIFLSEQAVIQELKMNSTTRGEVLIAGSVHGSNCTETYRTPAYTWTKALVNYRSEITMNDYTTNIDMELDQILLRLVHILYRKMLGRVAGSLLLDSFNSNIIGTVRNSFRCVFRPFTFGGSREETKIEQYAKQENVDKP